MPISYQGMISSVSIPAGAVGSLFKIPNATAMAGAAASSTALTGLFPAGSTALTSAASVTPSVSSYTTAKMAKLTTELPLMNAATAAQAKIASVDSVVSGNALSPAAGAAAIADAFKPSTAPCPSLSGPTGAFGALLHGSSDALNSIDSNATSALNTLDTTSLSTISSLMGLPPAADGAALMAQLKTQNPLQLASLQLSISLDSSLTSSISSMESSMTSSFGTSLSSFTSAVTAEADAVKAALDNLTGMHIVGLLESKNPCVASVMSATVDTAAVNPSVMAVASTPTTYAVPSTTAVATVNSTKPLAERPIEPARNPVPPVTNSNLYTSSQIDAMKATSLTYYDTLQGLKAGGAAEVKTIEEWKLANEYTKKQQAAGATPQAPIGTTTDPTIKAAWDAVYAAYVPQRDHYNTVTLPPITAAEKLYKAVFLEYNRRRGFGKYPYTTMEAQGQAVPEATKTTYLDSTT